MCKAIFSLEQLKEIIKMLRFNVGLSRFFSTWICNWWSYQEIAHKMQIVCCLMILLSKSIEGPKTELTNRPSYPFLSNSILLSVTVSRHDTINRFFSEINITKFPIHIEMKDSRVISVQREGKKCQEINFWMHFFFCTDILQVVIFVFKGGSNSQFSYPSGSTHCLRRLN